MALLPLSTASGPSSPINEAYKPQKPSTNFAQTTLSFPSPYLMQEPSSADESLSLPRRRTRRSSGTWQAVQPTLIQSPQIDVETLQEHFHLPITEVAKKLGVCATVLKKLCRKNGISRWPHRKIKSLDKTIATLEATKVKSPQQQAKIQEELDAARAAKDLLVHHPSSTNPVKSIKSRRRERLAHRHIEAVSEDSSIGSDSGGDSMSDASVLHNQSSHRHGRNGRQTRSATRASMDGSVSNSALALESFSVSGRTRSSRSASVSHPSTRSGAFNSAPAIHMNEGGHSSHHASRAHSHAHHRFMSSHQARSRHDHHAQSQGEMPTAASPRLNSISAVSSVGSSNSLNGIPLNKVPRVSSYKGIGSAATHNSLNSSSPISPSPGNVGHASSNNLPDVDARVHSPPLLPLQTSHTSDRQNPQQMHHLLLQQQPQLVPQAQRLPGSVSASATAGPSGEMRHTTPVTFHPNFLSYHASHQAPSLQVPLTLPGFANNASGNPGGNPQQIPYLMPYHWSTHPVSTAAPPHLQANAASAGGEVATPSNNPSGKTSNANQPSPATNPPTNGNYGPMVWGMIPHGAMLYSNLFGQLPGHSLSMEAARYQQALFGANGFPFVGMAPNQAGVPVPLPMAAGGDSTVDLMKLAETAAVGTATGNNPQPPSSMELENAEKETNKMDEDVKVPKIESRSSSPHSASSSTKPSDPDRLGTFDDETTGTTKTEDVQDENEMDISCPLTGTAAGTSSEVKEESNAIESPISKASAEEENGGGEVLLQ